MPGKEIKGRSPIANYRDGGRTGLKEGTPKKGRDRSATFGAKSKYKPLKGKLKWGSGPKPGTLEYFQLHTQKPRKPHKDGKKVKKNGPVRPIHLPWPTPDDPVSSKKKKK